MIGLSDFQYASSLISPTELEIPRAQPDAAEYFPTFLGRQLHQYATYYDEHLRSHFEAGLPFGDEGRSVVLPRNGLPIIDKIVRLIDGLQETVRYYYDGHLLYATEAFRRALNAVGFEHISLDSTIHTGMEFYRTRIRSSYGFTRRDLFHNPFENRGKVTTNRYSIPGLPALYVGDSTYVCWEEAGQERIQNLYFSRLRNERPVRVVRIQRLPDFVAMIDSLGIHEAQLEFLANYLILFPLSIACSIKTRSNTDVFRPEYIIPQSLLQYVTAEREMDGIMFPSAKVNYGRLRGVSAYNYVFPVKYSQSKGFCSGLSRTFSLTAPTSVELEELLSYGTQRTITLDAFTSAASQRKTIALADGVPRPYVTTAFGILEAALKKEELRHLDS